MQAKIGEFVMVEGFVPKNAEVRTTQKGGAYVTFSVAVGKREVNGQEETIWANCSAFGKIGQTVQGLKKGDRVLVIGKINVYTDSQGQQRKNLTCENAIVTPLSSFAETPPNATSERSIQQYEEILGDGEMPF